MVSMAVASAVLPFLPLLAKQVLLNNFLSDIPAMGIAGDNVDREWESTPHRWDIHLIRNFMVTFGLVSTCFDLLTFGVLLVLLGDTPELFRTGWFTESLLTELCIIFVIRTYKPFYASRPGRLLLYATLAVMVVALLLPYSPLRPLFGFVALPASTIIAMLIITILYVVVSELTKGIFFRRIRT
jgi:Mg2+-importing ATPase